MPNPSALQLRFRVILQVTSSEFPAERSTNRRPRCPAVDHRRSKGGRHVREWPLPSLAWLILSIAILFDHEWKSCRTRVNEFLTACAREISAVLRKTKSLVEEVENILGIFPDGARL